MGKLSDKLKKAAKIAVAGVAAYQGAKMLGKGKLKPTGAPAGAKTPSSSKMLGKVDVRKITGTGGTTMTGGKLKMTVDKNALPREIKEKADKLKAANEKMKKAVIKRKKAGKLSPTMPKTKSQADAISNNFGFGLGAKKGKMIKANTGRMNLLEQMGRLDAKKRPDSNVRAEKKRVISELKSGASKGKMMKYYKGGMAAVTTRGQGIVLAGKKTKTYIC
tara:strand:- start:221 stop:877 length:657 start_codon:yes stop_codon:yes gene_type:complete